MNNQIFFSTCQEMYMKSRTIIKIIIITVIINNTCTCSFLFLKPNKTQLFFNQCETKANIFNIFLACKIKREKLKMQTKCLKDINRKQNIKYP